jgi:hypothetical protein
MRRHRLTVISGEPGRDVERNRGSLFYLHGMHPVVCHTIALIGPSAQQ